MATSDGFIEVDLATRYQALNRRWWSGALPSVGLRWSKRMHVIAGKFWRTRGGHWEIVLSVPYHQHYPEEIGATLLHEMVHVWDWKQGARRRGVAHGATFRAEAGRVGAPLHCQGYHGMHRPYRYEWICPQCHRRSRSRIRRRWACKPCCDRHNGGRYSPKFELKLARELR